MSWNSHLLISFQCYDLAPIKALAIKNDNGFNREAGRFFEWIKNRPEENVLGLAWTEDGNHVDIERMAQALEPFFRELLSGVADGPLRYTQALFFYETEGSEQAKCYQYGYDMDDDKFKMTHYNLPFQWMVF